MQVAVAEQPSDDTPLWELAASQHGVVSRAQVRARCSEQQIRTLVAAGWLHRIHRAVYAVGHTKLTVRARWMAAVLACGQDAVLSHQDAAALHGLLKVDSGDIHVTAPTRHSIDGVRCHYARTLHPRDVAKIHGIPVTTLERVLLDLAEAKDRRPFTAALKQAQHEDRLDLRRINATIARDAGRRGIKPLSDALAQLTEEPGWTQSELERRLVELTRAAGLPLPLTNQYVEGELVDAYWPDHGLVVEVDGWKTHKTRDAFERDRARDSKLAAAGYRVMRFTYRRIRDDPAGVADELRRALNL
jgi:very-short-patch-repair endonuclease